MDYKEIKLKIETAIASQLMMMDMDELDLQQIPPVEIITPTPQETQFDDHSLSGSNYSLYMNKGSRRFMYDRYYISQTEEASVYAVFDGHGQSGMSSEFVSQNLHKNIQNQAKISSMALQTNILKQAFQKTEQELHNYALGYPESGTTALYVEVSPMHITVASLGDSQALIVKKGGKHQLLSTVHTPSNVQEKIRIEQAGGWVLNVGSIPRIQGKLAVSRAFGNSSIRKFLTSEPDIFTYIRDPEDVALVIATDGLWDILSIPDVAQMVDLNNYKIQDLSKTIYDKAQQNAKHYVRDNVTIITVALQ